jgi:hypothetical protein
MKDHDTGVSQISSRASNALLPTKVSAIHLVIGSKRDSSLIGAQE